jgi:Xaa-Pro dipeptidase
MSQLDVAVCVLVAPASQEFFVGFRTIYYPRPILALVDQETTTIVVPCCEEAEAVARARVDLVDVYYEHPGIAGPTSHLECLAERLRLIPRGSRIGLELDACPASLAELVTGRGDVVVDVGSIAAKLREVKEPAETELIVSAAEIANAAVAASLEAMAVGSTEIEIDQAGNAVAHAAAARRDAPVTLELLVITAAGAERSTFPHTLSSNRRLEAGDVVIHSRQIGLNGYRAELERTMVVGRPTSEQRRVFEVMRAAQQAGIEAVLPGARCCDVDRAARDVLADAGLGSYAFHRTGHGIGLGTEPPYLRFDDPAVLEEGMVVTVEPAVYVPGLGGFRHSDTLVVTKGGADVITSFPSDLGSLTVA